MIPLKKYTNDVSSYQLVENPTNLARQLWIINNLLLVYQLFRCPGPWLRCVTATDSGEKFDERKHDHLVDLFKRTVWPDPDVNRATVRMRFAEFSWQQFSCGSDHRGDVRFFRRVLYALRQAVVHSKSSHGGDRAAMYYLLCHLIYWQAFAY
jgi:hypothetical protein